MANRTELLVAAERRLLLDISHELRSPLVRLGVAVELARSGENLDCRAQPCPERVDRLNELAGATTLVPFAATRCDWTNSRNNWWTIR